MTTLMFRTPVPTTDKPPRPRRWIPLSLRMFVAILGILGVVAAWEGLRTYRQYLVLQEILPLGWSVRFRSRAPEWLLDQAGIERWELFGDVIAVDVDDFQGLRDWTHGIRWPALIVHTSDAGLDHLQELTTLEVLSLSNIHLTDAGLAHLRGLTKLKMLSLDNTQVTDAGLTHLKGLTSHAEIE